MAITLDTIIYSLLRKYIDDSIKGITGALAGKNCTIESTTKANGVTTIVFKWTADDGSVRRSTIQVKDGTPIYVYTPGDTYKYGDLAIYESSFYRCTVTECIAEETIDNTKWEVIGSPVGNYDIVQNASLLPTGFTSADRKMYYAIEQNSFYLWDGTGWYKQATLQQYTVMPTASARYLNRIIQYVGPTTLHTPIYTNACLYKCVSDGKVPATYSWELINEASDGLKQYEIMPSAGESYSGEIVQYMGESFNDFTKGRFYECKKIPDTFTQVTPESGDNPKANTWYEYDADHNLYTLTTDTAVDAEHTYYEVATFRYEWTLKNNTAYELAKTEGYIGTEQEWYKTIKSNPGNTMFTELESYNLGNTVKCDDYMCEHNNEIYFGHGRELYKVNIDSKVVSPISSINNALSYGTLQYYDDKGAPGIRGVAFYKDWMYVITRSQKPNKPSPLDDTTKRYGEIFQLNLSDYSIVDNGRVPYNGKGTDIKIHTASNGTTYAVACFQMEYIKFFIVDPTTGNLIEKDTQYTNAYAKVRPDDYQPEIDEHQKAEFFEKDGRVIVAAAGFADGIHLWDVTDIETERATLVCNWYSNRTENVTLWRKPELRINPVPTDPNKPINPKNSSYREFIDGEYVLTNDTSVVTDKRYYVFSKGQYHTFQCTVDYPYIYATLGPSSDIATPDLTYGTNNRRMGVLVLDISDFAHPIPKIVNIPVDDMCEFRGYDPRPTHIIKRKDKLFLNNADRGIAVFDVSKPGEPVYVGTKQLNDMTDISGMCIIDNYLYVGDDPVDNSGVTYTEVIPKNHPVKSSDSEVVETHKPYYTYNSTTGEYTPVENPTGSPKSQGWYAWECPVDSAWKETKPYLDGEFRTTTDTKAVPGKRYFLMTQNNRFIKKLEIYEGYNKLFHASSNEPTSDGYGALIDAGIMENFNDVTKYPPTDCVNLTKMSGANDAAKLQAAISSGKIILVPHGMYDLAGTAINFPLNRIVSIIGENANSCVLKNCNFKATGGLSLKNLTLDGGTKMSIENLSWQPVVIIDATPKVDTAAHTYINCIFKGNGTTNYASEASQEKEDLSYNGINRFKIAKDVVDNCVFDGFIYSGVNHCITVDYASFTNNTFRNIGIVDDVPFDLVASPSGSPKSQSLAENTENVYEEVQNPEGNPKTQGWFQQTDGNYVKTSDTSVVEAHLPYYEIKAPVGTFFCSTDSSVNATKRYYKPKSRYVGALRLGDSSGNNVNEVVQCTLYHNNFENIFNNEYYWDVTHCDECNFIKIRARYITVTHNRFKDLVGYGGDREGVYVKAFYADISYNYIENGGMGEGYICCKNIKTSEYDPNGFELVPNPSGNPKTEGWFEKETPVTDPPTYKKTSDTSVKANKDYFTGTLIHQRDWLKRFVHIHDNVLIGYGGRGIRTYYNATVENNTVYIRNAKSAIWSGGDQSNTDALLYRFYTNSIIKNNKVSIGFDKFYLTNPKTLALYASVVVDGKGIEPTDYHARTEAIVGINDGRTVISGNTVTVEMSDALNATLASWYYAYKAIFFQNTRELVECTDNQIITNGTKVVSGASYVKLIGIMATWEDYKLFPYVKGITINICRNDILDGYNPMHLNLVGLTKAETIVNVKDNTVWNPSEVYGGRVNRGCELEMYDKKASNDNTDKKTFLVFTSPQKNAGFTTAYVCTDCDNVETEDISWVQHVASLA